VIWLGVAKFWVHAAALLLALGHAFNGFKFLKRKRVVKSWCNRCHARVFGSPKFCPQCGFKRRR
jgi:rRNA maturation endonuclease Nob1